MGHHTTYNNNNQQKNNMFASAVRRCASAATRSENAFIAERQHLEHHAGGAADLWKKFTFVAVPACFAAGVYIIASLEHSHIEHKNWPHMHKMEKEYPWGGKKSLFYGPDNYDHSK